MYNCISIFMNDLEKYSKVKQDLTWLPIASKVRMKGDIIFFNFFGEGSKSCTCPWQSSITPCIRSFNDTFRSQLIFVVISLIPSGFSTILATSLPLHISNPKDVKRKTIQFYVSTKLHWLYHLLNSIELTKTKYELNFSDVVNSIVVILYYKDGFIPYEVMSTSLRKITNYVRRSVSFPSINNNNINSQFFR